MLYIIQFSYVTSIQSIFFLLINAITNCKNISPIQSTQFCNFKPINSDSCLFAFCKKLRILLVFFLLVHFFRLYLRLLCYELFFSSAQLNLLMLHWYHKTITDSEKKKKKIGSGLCNPSSGLRRIFFFIFYVRLSFCFCHFKVPVSL